MKTKRFIDLWNAKFPFIVPLGCRLRTCFKERWLRVHSLPQGKRYPDTSIEVQEVLLRQNQVLSDLMRGSDVYLLIGSYSYSSPGFPDGYDDCLLTKEFEVLPSLLLNQILPEEYDSKVYLRLSVRRILWKKDLYNNLLKKVMDDKVGVILFVNFKKMHMVYPYDGGMDIIFKDRTEKLIFKRKYKKWVAKNPNNFRKLPQNFRGPTT